MKSVPIPLLPILLGMSLVSLSCSESGQNQQNSHYVPEQWARAAAQGSNTAAYFYYVNKSGTADTLKAVNSTVANKAGIHESYEEGGLKGMREVSSLPVISGDTLRFQPGGLHIMLMGLHDNLSPGDSIQIQLTFTGAGSVTKSIAVKSP